MGATGMAAAMGTAVLLYLVLSGRLSAEDGEERRLLKEASERRELEKKRRKEEKKMKKKNKKKKKEKTISGRWPERPPATWGEAAAVAARTVKFTWKETLGKWPLAEICFGLKYYMKQQGNLQHEYTEGNSVQLNGPKIRAELVDLLRYLRLCMYFSKKPYKIFMEFGGYTQENVLLQKSKARLLKPSFTIVSDPESESFLLLIRGAISVKDRLTAATGAEVPFHHIVLREGKVTDLVLGHAHCGMVAAARWIAERAIPCLRQAVHQYPHYNIKIIGHSMGAGIAAILTYILREHEELSSSTCIALAPAACMTWELAESGKDFITTLVNRTDLVPSFCKVSAAHLRTEVMASSWLNDLRDQIQRTRFLNLMNRYVTFMRSHIPFISDPKSKVVDADSLLTPTATPNPQEETDEMRNTRRIKNKRCGLCCFSCIGPYHAMPAQIPKSGPDAQNTPENNTNTSTETEKSEKYEKSEKFEKSINNSAMIAELIVGCSGGSMNQDSDFEEEGEERENEIRNNSQQQDIIIAREISELQVELAQEQSTNSIEEGVQLQFYPPGRIMHMVVVPAPERDPPEVPTPTDEDLVTIYETPRDMYTKIRLARSMIRDHYMPRYIKTMELLINKLAREEVCSNNNGEGSVECS